MESDGRKKRKSFGFSVMGGKRNQAAKKHTHTDTHTHTRTHQSGS